MDNDNIRPVLLPAPPTIHNVLYGSYQVEFAPKVMYIGLHMVIIKFHQVLIENDLQLDINAKLDLESQNENQK